MAHLYTATHRHGYGEAIYRTFGHFPAACFTMTLMSDLAYWRTTNLMWQNFSSWLLFVGLVAGGFAAVGLIIHAIRGADSGFRLNTPHFLGVVVVWILALLNSLVHAGDGWTAVIPWGLALSILTFFAMVAVLFIGGPFLPDELE